MPEQNIRLPAEWELQSGLLLTWPHDKTDWRENLIAVESVYLEIIKHVSQYQTIIIACRDKAHKNHIDLLLQESKISQDQYRLYIAASNDSWTRDHGPITVLKENRPLLLDFTFNGWGGKYPADLDNKITSTLHKSSAFEQTKLKNIDLILEGGSIEYDGNGTLLITTACLLSSQRNKKLSQMEIEEKLLQYLGATRILWIKQCQLNGDDTDGHIDTMARFVSNDTIVYIASDNHSDPNYQALCLLENQLQSFSQVNDKPYKLIKLPSVTLTNSDREYLPASYANFLICNNIVLMPFYDVDTDNQAFEILNNCFIDREIIGINSRSLIEQRGSLHCAAMQLPVGVLE